MLRLFAPGNSWAPPADRGAGVKHEQWQMKVVGVVSRRREDGVRIAVPQGDYTMTKLDAEIYELCRDGTPAFGLTRREVLAYLSSKDLQSPSREWP